MRFGKLLVCVCMGVFVAGISSARAGVLIAVDKGSQRMSVSVDGQRVYSWPVSTGRSGYDTPSGSFTPSRLEEEHYSKEWDDAPMPHAIFFTSRGHAIHGSNATGRLGTPASHGCVRLAPSKAAKLFALVEREGVGNTKVVISGGTDRVALKRSPSRHSGRYEEPNDDYGGSDSPPYYGAGEQAAEDAGYAPAGEYGRAPNTTAILDWR